MIRAEFGNFSEPLNYPADTALSTSSAVSEYKVEVVFSKSETLYTVDMPDQSSQEEFPTAINNNSLQIGNEKTLSPELEPIEHDIVVEANRALEAGKAGGLVGAMLQFSEANDRAHITSIGWDGKISLDRDVEKWNRDREHWKGRKNRVSADAELEGPQEVFELIRPNGKISIGAIPLTGKEYHAHYEDISNNWLWKVLHSKPETIQGEFTYDNYAIHDKVQDRFADTYADYVNHHPAKMRDTWNHDYHLMLLAPKLRDRGVTGPIGHFIHIPWPKPEMLNLIPEKLEKEGFPTRYPRKEILEGLMGNDLVGFQTIFDVSNFLQCLDSNFGLTHDQLEKTANGYIIKWGNRKVKIGSYPIGVDAASIREKLDSPEVREEVARVEKEYEGKVVIADVSRLDISKGIESQLMAYKALLEKLETKDPELLDKLKFVRIIAPSRENVPGYTELLGNARRLAEEINKQFESRGHGDKVEIIYDNVPNHKVLALFESKTTRVAFVTPEIDGMNLVVKEAAATRNKNLRFVVGEGAGVSHEVKGMALRPQVSKDPEDVMTLARNLYAALTLPDGVAGRWKERLDQQVTTHGVGEWGSNFIDDLHSMKAAA